MSAATKVRPPRRHPPLPITVELEPLPEAQRLVLARSFWAAFGQIAAELLLDDAVDADRAA